jgi:hypothetical protein
MDVTAKGDEPVEGIAPGSGDVIDRIEAFDPFPDRAVADDQIDGQPLEFVFIGRRLPLKILSMMSDHRLQEFE